MNINVKWTEKNPTPTNQFSSLSVGEFFFLEKGSVSARSVFLKVSDDRLKCNSIWVYNKQNHTTAYGMMCFFPPTTNVEVVTDVTILVTPPSYE